MRRVSKERVYSEECQLENEYVRDDPPPVNLEMFITFSYLTPRTIVSKLPNPFSYHSNSFQFRLPYKKLKT